MTSTRAKLGKTKAKLDPCADLGLYTEQLPRFVWMILAINAKDSVGSVGNGTQACDLYITCG